MVHGCPLLEAAIQNEWLSYWYRQKRQIIDERLKWYSDMMSVQRVGLLQTVNS